MREETWSFVALKQSVAWLTCAITIEGNAGDRECNRVLGPSTCDFIISKNLDMEIITFITSIYTTKYTFKVLSAYLLLCLNINGTKVKWVNKRFIWKIDYKRKDLAKTKLPQHVEQSAHIPATICPLQVYEDENKQLIVAARRYFSHAILANYSRELWTFFTPRSLSGMINSTRLCTNPCSPGAVIWIFIGH